MRHEPWVTGVGCATSLGLDFNTLADNVLAGRSGIATIRHFDAALHISRIAAVLPKLNSPPGYPAEDFAGRNPWMQMLLWCAANALRDAGLASTQRIGLVVGI